MTRHFEQGRISTDGRVETRIIDLRELVEFGRDPDKQASLRRLLIEEEDKLAKNRERLETSKDLLRKGPRDARKVQNYLR